MYSPHNGLIIRSSKNKKGKSHMPRPSDGIIIAPYLPALQSQIVLLARRYREELPDNDTFCLYYDLIAQRFPIDHYLSYDEMAIITRQSVVRLKKSFKLLIDLGYVSVTETQAPDRRWPIRQITLRDLNIQAAAPVIPVPPPPPAPVTPPPPVPVSEPMQMQMLPTGSESTPEDGWGNNPVRAVHTLIDEVHTWDWHTVSPEIYFRQSREAKQIVAQYAPHYVRTRLTEILIQEPYWRNRRISPNDLLSRLPQRKETAQHDRTTPATNDYSRLDDFAAKPYEAEKG